MLTTPELVKILVKMKTRLAFAKQEKKQVLANVAVAFLAMAVVSGISVYIVTKRDAVDNSTQLMLILTVLLLSWLAGALLVGTGEAVLDPGRFVIYPIGVRQLITAFFFAAFIGVAAPGTLIIGLSSLSHATGPLGALLLVVGAVVLATTAVLTARLAIAAMSVLVRGRRTKEVAGLLTMVLAASAGLAPQFLSGFSDQITESRRATARAILAWVPWGWGPEAIGSSADGNHVRALLFLALAGVFVVALGEVWQRLMTKILTTRPAASVVTTTEGGLVPRSIRPFGRSPTTAATARSLRQFRRDPREFLELASFMPLVLVSGIPAFESIRAGDPEAVLGVTGIGVALGITAFNMFGADGRSFGVDLLAARDMTPIIFGKALARAVLGAPFILLIGFGLAAATGGWPFLLTSYFIASTTMFCMLAVGMVVSVRYPLALPEKVTVGAGSAGGAAGCAAAIFKLIGMFVALILAGIVVGPVIALSIAVSPLFGTAAGLVALAYGVTVFWFAGKYAGKQATIGAPELFQTLSKVQ